MAGVRCSIQAFVLYREWNIEYKTARKEKEKERITGVKSQLNKYSLPAVWGLKNVLNMRENEQECAWPYRAKISQFDRYYQIENNNS